MRLWEGVWGVWECVYMCVHVHIEAKVQSQVSSLFIGYLIFWDSSHQTILGGLRPPRFSCLCPQCCSDRFIWLCSTFVWVLIIWCQIFRLKQPGYHSWISSLAPKAGFVHFILYPNTQCQYILLTIIGAFICSSEAFLLSPSLF